MSAAALKKLKIRQRDMMGRLGEIGGMEPADYTDEIREETKALRLEMRANGEQQTALELSGVGDPEPIETRTETPADTADSKLLELRDSLHFGKYVAAALAGRPVLSGAEAEYNAEKGIMEGHFPMELLARSAEGPLETRAIRDVDATANQGSWLDRVFYDSAAMRVGISFRDAGPGVAAYPVTTAGGAGVQRGRTQAVTESTYTIAVTEIKPSRHAVHGIYSIEDNARLPGMADAIERDMRAAIVASVDLACFNGDAGANENVADVTGLATASITETTITQADKVDAFETVAAFAALIDGLHASTPADLNIVSTVGANTLWMSTQANANRNETVAQVLAGNGLSWMARGGIAADSDADEFGAFVGLARGMEGSGIAAVWNSGELVRDPYSNADTGEVKLTLNYLWQLAFPRTANYKRIKFVT